MVSVFSSDSGELPNNRLGGRDDKLFAAAAAESQSFGAIRHIEGAQYQYDALVNAAGCADKRNSDQAKDGTLACLRSINQHDLQKKVHDKFPKGFTLPYPEVGPSKRKPVYMWVCLLMDTFKYLRR